MAYAIVLTSKFQHPENRRREALRAAHEQQLETLIELLNHYLTLKSARKSETSQDTRRLYALAVKQFLEFTSGQQTISGLNNGRIEITRIEPEEIETWLVQLQARGLEPGSVATYLYGVRALYRALVWAKACERNPANDVKPPRDPTPAHAKKSALSPALYKTLMAAPHNKYDASDSRGNRDAALLALGGSAGLRAKEIVGLDVTDLDLTLKRLTVRAGKGGKRRMVPLSKQLLELLSAWLLTRSAMVIGNEIPESENALLVSVSRNNSGGKRLSTDGARFIARGYYSGMGLPPEMWGLHTLRRTAGTHLYRATRDLHVVADVLGHASVNTSAIYAKMDMDVRREAVEAMEKFRDDG